MYLFEQDPSFFTSECLNNTAYDNKHLTMLQASIFARNNVKAKEMSRDISVPLSHSKRGNSARIQSEDNLSEQYQCLFVSVTTSSIIKLKAEHKTCIVFFFFF